MSDWDRIGFIPQGWQCPVCKRVYSPMTPMCYHCGDSKTVTIGTTTTTQSASTSASDISKDGLYNFWKKLEANEELSEFLRQMKAIDKDLWCTK